MQQTSETTRQTTEATYEFKASQLVTNGPAGRLTWRRIGPAPTIAPKKNTPPDSEEKSTAKNRSDDSPSSKPKSTATRSKINNDPPPRRSSDVERKARDVIKKIRGFGF
jgi:hypothetical protein